MEGGEESKELAVTGVVTNPAVTNNKCQILSKQGNPCGQPIIHPYSVCAMHINEVNTPGQSGRYDPNIPQDLHQDFRHQMASPNPKDMSGELAVARTIVTYYMQKIGETHTDEGKMYMTDNDADQMMKAILLVKGVIESQAKVNPERVITLQDMQKIINRIIDIIRDNIPADPESMMNIRKKIVKDIQRFCMADLVSRATELQFGGTLPKSQGT